MPCVSQELRDRMSARALETLSEEYFTVANLVNWMYICLKVGQAQTPILHELVHSFLLCLSTST